MINRAVLENPKLIRSMDFYNDYTDTHNWLSSLGTPRSIAVADLLLITDRLVRAYNNRDDVQFDSALEILASIHWVRS